MVEINTERLIMRGWQESDLAPWAAMNADPQVRQYVGPLLTFGQASAVVLNFQDDLDRHGFGFWALEVRASGEFIGFTGLNTLDEEMPLTGTEVGWRLARRVWGHGYATEAALAALRHGFDTIGLPEILAVTMTRNLRSQRVMRRIGMTTDPRRISTTQTLRRAHSAVMWCIANVGSSEPLTPGTIGYHRHHDLARSRARWPGHARLVRFACEWTSVPGHVGVAASRETSRSLLSCNERVVCSN